MFIENTCFDWDERLKTIADVHDSIFKTFQRIVEHQDWKDYFFSENFDITVLFAELERCINNFLAVIIKKDLDTQLLILNHYIHLYYGNRNVYYIKTRIFEYREALIQLEVPIENIKEDIELNNVRIDLIKIISRFIPMSSI
tara:strand:- start:1262 stop:1687 length:426 start_codon:yes stop_codon:yes gene_type:complete